MNFKVYKDNFFDDVLFHVKKDKEIKFILPQKRNDVFFRENDDYFFCISGCTYLADSSSLSMDLLLDYVELHVKDKGLAAIAESFVGGIWSFFCFSKLSKKLHVFSDFLSIKTVFYSFNESCFTIGGSQFDVSQNKTVNMMAMQEYLDVGYLALHDSLFEDVRRLDASETLIFNVNEHHCTINFSDYMEYPEVNERYQDINTAAESINSIIDNVLARIPNDAKVSCGLSGGYDSRYLAVKLKDKDVTFVTYDNPGTKEFEVATKVASAIENQTNKVEISSDAVVAAISNFPVRIGTQDSLNASHIAELFNSLYATNPSFVVDGFIGDTVISGNYFFKIKDGAEPFFQGSFLFRFI